MRNILVANVVASMFLASSVSAGEKVDQRLSLDGASKVMIENQRGKVSIVGGSKSEVTVTGELDEKAERFIFERDGSTIVVKVEMPDYRGNRKGRNNEDGSDLTINLPSSVKVSFNGISSHVSASDLTQGLEVNTISGDIKLENIEEHVEVNSVSGNVQTSNIHGKLVASAVSGDISDKNSRGRIQLNAVSGDIESTSSANEVVVEVVSGEVNLSLEQIDELSISSVSGDAEVKLDLNDNGVVKLSSVSGDFDMQFQSGVDASFRLKTNAGGNIKNLITSAKAERGKYVPSEKLNFVTGSGKATVKANTVSGTIKVAH